MYLLLAAALTLPFGPLAQAETPFADHEKLALRSVTSNLQTVPRYHKLDLTLDLRANYANPFDPEEIAVTAQFTSPQGKTVTVDGFLYQEYVRHLEGRNETLEPTARPVWKVRFAPDTVGVWKYRIAARDRTGTVRLPARTFRVIPSRNPGFIRRSRRNPHVFAFDGEKPYFAVGENMGWGGSRGTYDYEDWLSALGKAGGNWIRVWMNTWNTGLEWMQDIKDKWSTGWYHGLGVYNLANAWKLDKILDLAESHGIYTMLTFGTYGEFTTGGFFGEGQWPHNPYNAANGGPCARPEDFWTNPTARKLYRRRLRYIVARYGYRTGIQAWEFWNEANPPAFWVGEMAQFLKGTGAFQGHILDPYRHLITNTYGNDAIWKIPEVDFTQTHHYGTGDIADHAPVVASDARHFFGYDKPHLMAEFGIDWRDTDRKYDPEGHGVNMHNGMWAAMATGDTGTAMLWWWDNYVHPLHLYAPFTSARRFADTVPWTSRVCKPLAVDPARVLSGPDTFTDLTLPVNSGWGKNNFAEFTITPQGLAGSATLPQYLYSPGKADLRTTPTFHVRFTHPGRFIVRVNEVSTFARIRFLLDGRPVREIALAAAPSSDPNVKPEYEKTEQNKQYGNWVAQYHKDYGIEVPAGEHAITLDNVEGDWASLERITLTGYRSSRYPQMNLYALSNGRQAILWAQNALHNWKNVAEKKPIPAISGAETVVHGLPDGRYRIEWWDTWRGEVTGHQTAVCQGHALPLSLPDIPTDVAAHILPESG